MKSKLDNLKCLQYFECILTDKDEKFILEWLNDKFKQSDCFRPQQIYDHNKNEFSNESIVVSTCRRLHAKKLIDEITSTVNDPDKRDSCYSISKAGMDELNPNTLDKQMFKLAKIGASAGIIAAITSIIAIIVILVG